MHDDLRAWARLLLIVGGTLGALTGALVGTLRHLTAQPDQ